MLSESISVLEDRTKAPILGAFVLIISHRLCFESTGV